MARNVRRGVTQATLNEECMQFISGSIFFASVIMGLYMHSWLWFGATLFGSFIAFAIPQVRAYFIVVLIIGWGSIGYLIGISFFGQNAGYVLAAIGAVIGFGGGSGAAEFVDDISADAGDYEENV